MSQPVTICCNKAIAPYFHHYNFLTYDFKIGPAVHGVWLSMALGLEKLGKLCWLVKNFSRRHL